MTRTAQLDRPSEILLQIHALARELRDLAGDSLVITIEPAKPQPFDASAPKVVTIDTAATNGHHHAAPDVAAQVFEVLSEIEPATHSAVAKRLNLSIGSKAQLAIRDTMVELAAAGQLVEAGKYRNGMRYRRRRPADEIGFSAPRPKLPGGASSAASNGHGLPPQGQINEATGLDLRVVHSLREEAATVTELSMRLDIPRRDITAAVARLTEHGRIVECGKRPPRQHTVYGATDD